MTRLEQLKQLLDTKTFHHATYRNFGTLWEGLHIYKRSETGFRGFDHIMLFSKNDPDLKQAEEMCKGTGVSVGAYGQG